MDKHTTKKHQPAIVIHADRHEVVSGDCLWFVMYWLDHCEKPAAGICLCADQARHELTQPPPAVWFGRWLVVSVGCCVVRSLVVWVAGLLPT